MIIQAKNNLFYNDPWIEQGDYAFGCIESNSAELFDAGISKVPAVVTLRSERSIAKWLKEQGFVAKPRYDAKFSGRANFRGKLKICNVFPLELGDKIPVPTEYLSGPFQNAMTRYVWDLKLTEFIIAKAIKTPLIELRQDDDYEFVKFLYDITGSDSHRQLRSRVKKFVDATYHRSDIPGASKWIPLG